MTADTDIDMDEIVKKIAKDQYVSLYKELLILYAMDDSTKDKAKMLEIAKTVKELENDYTAVKDNLIDLRADAAKCAEKEKKIKEYKELYKKYLSNELRLNYEQEEDKIQQLNEDKVDICSQLRDIRNTSILSDDELETIEENIINEFKNNEQKTIESEYNSAENAPAQNAPAQNAPAQNAPTKSSKVNKNDTKKKSKTHTIKKKKWTPINLIFDAIVAGASIATIMLAAQSMAAAPVLAGVGVISFIAARGNGRLIRSLHSSRVQVKNVQIDKKNSKIEAYNQKHSKKKKTIKNVSNGVIKENFIAAALQILSMIALTVLSGSMAPQIIVGLISFIVTKVIPNKTIFKSI